ncbi:MAG: hypothetical protein O2951_14535 [Bacteroidetes bacterium]|nr:hypothetical protein [Bacteroidota bacterium]
MVISTPILRGRNLPEFKLDHRGEKIPIILFSFIFALMQKRNNPSERSAGREKSRKFNACLAGQAGFNPQSHRLPR